MPVVPNGSAQPQCSTSNRFQFLDVARGSAMFFVLLSHFAFTYFPERDASRSLLTLIGMVASPTFIIINGLMVGLLYRLRPDDFARIRILFTDRGLFLLTIGHLLLLVSHVSYAVRFISITDAVGVCMLTVPWLVTVLRGRDLLRLGSAMFCLSMLVSVFWEPTGHSATIVKEALFGGYEGSHLFGYSFAILPWLSFNIVAAALGDRLGRHYLRGGNTAMERLLLKTAASGVALAAILNGACHALIHFGYAAGLHRWRVHSPFQKWPPSPIYLLFYGGIGLLLIVGCLRAVEDPRGRSVVSALATLGQTSFVLFVVQYAVYFEILPRVRGYLAEGWWPVYFALSIPLVIVPALVWHRAGGNRLLTVGYQRWASGRRAAAGSMDVERFHPRQPAELAR
jgi:hypothetical protein